jgi:hypothetical protein
MIGPKSDNGYGPFGSTSGLAGPKRFREERAMHENPRPTEEEQELAQTDRMGEEEEQRSYAPVEAADEDESEE